MIELEKSFELGLKDRTITFDFTQCDFLSPTAIIYLSIWRDVFSERGIKTYARIKKNAFARFVSGMAFVDVPYIGKSVFLNQMIKLHRCNCVKECMGVHKEIVDMIVKKSSLPKDTVAAVDYMLNEIWDNAGVHGYKCYETSDYPKPVYFCGFNYTTHFEIAIADNGQGIHNSLTSVAQYSDLSPDESLQKSILKGSTGHPAGSPGFGLYCSSEFMRKGNCLFSIWSSGRKLQILNGEENIHKSKFCSGTIISLIVKKDTMIPFSEILDNRDVDEYFETMLEGSLL
jgi:hypothetical protein